MTSFSDDLRATLAKKQASLLARQMVEERQLDEARRRADETRRAAERLSREVFLPLLTEFLSVMEQAGVLCGGVVEEDRAGVPASAGAADMPAKAGTPTGCRLRAQGTAPESPHYEIRVAAAASDDGRIEATLACLDRTAAEFGACEPEMPLVEFPPKSFGKPPAINHDAPRQWCAGLLKKCAESCMEANRKKP